MSHQLRIPYPVFVYFFFLPKQSPSLDFRLVLHTCLYAQQYMYAKLLLYDAIYIIYPMANG